MKKLASYLAGLPNREKLLQGVGQIFAVGGGGTQQARTAETADCLSAAHENSVSQRVCKN